MEGAFASPTSYLAGYNYMVIVPSSVPLDFYTSAPHHDLHCSIRQHRAHLTYSRTESERPTYMLYGPTRRGAGLGSQLYTFRTYHFTTLRRLTEVTGSIRWLGTYLTRIPFLGDVYNVPAAYVGPRIPLT